MKDLHCTANAIICDCNELLKKPLNEPTLAIQDYNVPEPMPLYREVSSAILHLKRRKAPGVDGIPADLIRARGLNAVEALDTD